MPCPENRQSVSFVGFNQDQPPFQQAAQRDMTWGQAPIQQGWNVPAHHHVEQSTAFAPFFSSVKIEPESNQQMQFPPMVEQSFSMVPPCSTGYPAFGSRLQNQVYYTQGQTETEKRSARALAQTTLKRTRPEWLPKSLYFSKSSTWAEFYRNFLNYARDKHWSSQECKTNMGYVLEGSAAEYFNILNIQSPNLPYYDLLNRMEDFMEGPKSSSVLSPVNLYHYQNLADSQIKHPAEVFPSYWVPFTLVHILGEITETAKHHLDVLTCNNVSNNQHAGDPADTEEAVSPMRRERGTPVRHTQAFAPQALYEPSYVLYTYRLKNESNCVPEQVVTPNSSSAVLK